MRVNLKKVSSIYENIAFGFLSLPTFFSYLKEQNAFFPYESCCGVSYWSFYIITHIYCTTRGRTTLFPPPLPHKFTLHDIHDLMYTRMYLHTAGNLEAQKNEGKSGIHFQKSVLSYLYGKKFLWRKKH